MASIPPTVPLGPPPPYTATPMAAPPAPAPAPAPAPVNANFTLTDDETKWLKDNYLSIYYWTWEASKTEGIKKTWVDQTVLDPFIDNFNHTDRPRAGYLSGVYRVFTNASRRIHSGNAPVPLCPPGFIVPESVADELPTPTSDPEPEGNNSSLPGRATWGKNEWRLANAEAVAGNGRQNAPGQNRGAALRGYSRAMTDGWNNLTEIQQAYWNALANEKNEARCAKPPPEHIADNQSNASDYVYASLGGLVGNGWNQLGDVCFHVHIIIPQQDGTNRVEAVTVAGQKSSIHFKVPGHLQQQYEQSFLEPLRTFKELKPVEFDVEDAPASGSNGTPQASSGNTDESIHPAPSQDPVALPNIEDRNSTATDEDGCSSLVVTLLAATGTGNDSSDPIAPINAEMTSGNDTIISTEEHASQTSAGNLDDVEMANSNDIIIPNSATEAVPQTLTGDDSPEPGVQVEGKTSDGDGAVDPVSTVDTLAEQDPSIELAVSVETPNEERIATTSHQPNANGNTNIQLAHADQANDDTSTVNPRDLVLSNTPGTAIVDTNGASVVTPTINPDTPNNIPVAANIVTDIAPLQDAAAASSGPSTINDPPCERCTKYGSECVKATEKLCMECRKKKIRCSFNTNPRKRAASGMGPPPSEPGSSRSTRTTTKRVRTA
ncbi:hypothetical protein VNI00_015122 [Paramarasmius palmivorus]|uniref:Zn(2)-C6 fungal-type domain-containing protein n=1 Tax=Paramarasmius palmivorus TaxID=297713 RepID=A0AAW0BPN6_9AGAR